MMQIQAENTLSLHFINSSSSSDNDIKVFTNFIKVCKVESDRAGFKNLFTNDERDLIDKIYKQIIPNEHNNKQ